MNIRQIVTILAILTMVAICVQPAFAETTMTSDNIEKDIATSYYNHGDTQLVKGNYEEAIQLFDLALASNTTMIKKTDALLYLYRDKAYAQIQLKKYDDALTTLNAGVALYPKDPMIWNNKGYALYNLGKYDEALSAYNSAVSFDKNYTIAHLNRGDTLSKMGRYSDAVAAYTRADETDPGNQAAAEGLLAAKKGQEASNQNMVIIVGVILIIAIAFTVWFVKFRKPGDKTLEKAKSKK